MGKGLEVEVEVSGVAGSKPQKQCQMCHNNCTVTTLTLLGGVRNHIQISGGRQHKAKGMTDDGKLMDETRDETSASRPVDGLMA